MSRFEFTLELFLWLLSKPGQHLLAIAQQLDLRRLVGHRYFYAVLAPV